MPGRQLSRYSTCWRQCWTSIASSTLRDQRTLCGGAQFPARALAQLTVNRSCCIAQEGDVGAGFTPDGTHLFRQSRSKRTFVFNDLFVAEAGSPAAGVGQALIARCAASYATALGARFLTLSTAKTNEGAQALYQVDRSGQREETFARLHADARGLRARNFSRGSPGGQTAGTSKKRWPALSLYAALARPSW